MKMLTLRLDETPGTTDESPNYLEFLGMTIDGSEVAVTHVARESETDRAGDTSPARSAVALALWRHLLGDQEGTGPDGQDQRSIILCRDKLGRPFIRSRPDRAGSLAPCRTGTASISFSHVPGQTWAGMTLSGQHLGIDAASADEFPDDYPFHRAFGQMEMRSARAEVIPDTTQAAALLWSAKESVVKALGCGFHLADPLDLDMRCCLSSTGTVVFRASLARRMASRVSLPEEFYVQGLSFRQCGLWVSVALSDSLHNCGQVFSQHAVHRGSNCGSY